MLVCESLTRHQLLRALDQAQVVTVNQRLARALREAYATRRRSDGDSAWRQPHVSSWEHWQLQLLQQLAEDDRLLSEAQELHLWQQVIAEGLSPELKLQLQVPATARMAREAHALLISYAVDFTVDAASEDHRMFLVWRQAYRQRLAQLDALERAELPALILKAFADGDLEPPAQLIVAGFDDLRPDQVALLDKLAALGTVIGRWSGEDERQASLSLVAAADPEDEVRRCALWARELLEQGNARLAVVISEPHLYRTLVEETLLAELAPQALLEGQRLEGLVSFSLGGALAEEGIVASALRILSLDRTLHFNDISSLLRSPWLGDLPHEDRARMRLESDLREAGELYWSPRSLQGFKPRVYAPAGRPQTRQGEANYLSSLMASLSKSLAAGRQPRHASEWAAALRQLLLDCGWPGQRELNSRDYQARNEFFELFDELASLDRLGRPLKRSEAMAFLSRRAQERAFQVKESTGAVQVMGLLEATGLDFDHLWVLGLHDGAFPASPRPNPFIPVPLQRAQSMPHADASRELEFAGQVAARLFCAAPEVVVSFPQQFEGSERQVSPLVTTGEPLPPPAVESCDPFRCIRKQPGLLEEITDRQAPPIHSHKPVSGGTSLLKDQALCPFRAFAHHRLRSEELTRLDIGLNAMQRGTLVHHMLEAYWKDTSDQQSLCRQPLDARQQALRKAADAALSRLERDKRHDLPPDIRQIEQERLLSLGLEWLEVEAGREPFRVEELEKPHESVVGSLTIRTKVDRIDRLAAGGLAIIDYKTGKPDALQWLHERVAEPQLPVYVRDFSDQQIAAVLFAQVRAGECRFRGISDDQPFPGLPERRLNARLEELDFDYPAVLAHWDRALPRLGDSFVAGDAAVEPLDGETTCRYCDYPTLCRILESRQLLKETDDD